jgi:phospholipase/carboxylesterase
MPKLVHRARLPKMAAAEWPAAGELPAGGERLPAVVMVHGWQGNEKVMRIFEPSVPPAVVIVSPRAPVEVAADSYGWFLPDADETAFEAGLEALRSFIEELPQIYPVDPERVLLLGFSQGAAMSYAVLLSEPRLTMGVAALAGFLPKPVRRWLEPRRLADKPVFIAHGTADETLPVEQARVARDALVEAGALVEYHEYEVGHKLNAQGVRDLTQWLAAQLRQGRT